MDSSEEQEIYENLHEEVRKTIALDGSWMDVRKTFVGKFLEENGFEEISKLYRENPEILAELKNDSLPSYQQYAEIKKKIKQTQDKQGLSKQLKEAKQKLKEERKLITGASEYLNLHETFIRYCSRSVKALQDLLVNGTEGKHKQYSLDAAANEALDKDPGTVSGDCTMGRPLPFYDRRVHNVKVFDPDNRHVGNIYLLETYTDDRKKVWHLDAIQLPSKANWDETIGNLVDPS
jgi:hypothetical protein